MAEKFASDWLSLREPVDRRARNVALTQRVVADLVADIGGAEPGQQIGSPRIVDIGAGQGATLRYLAPHLARAIARHDGGRPEQQWVLVDTDPGLLATAERRAIALNAELRRRDLTCVSVTQKLADLAEVDLRSIFQGAHLVTASAFLDLVSAGWIENFADALTQANCPVWISLSVDGLVSWTPRMPGDWRIQRAFRQDQERYKGFGPGAGTRADDSAALGVAAPFHLATALEARGYGVELAPSAWRVGPERFRLQSSYLSGAAGAARAAIEKGTPNGVSHWRLPDLDWTFAWQRARQQMIDDGRSSLWVGHMDLYGRPR